MGVLILRVNTDNALRAVFQQCVVFIDRICAKKSVFVTHFIIPQFEIMHF